MITDRIDLGRNAPMAVVPLFAVGIAITAVGIGLQLAQNTGMIEPQRLLGHATIFGILSKIGGAAVIAGLICTALRAKAAPDENGQTPLEVPLSAMVRPAANLIQPKRPTRVSRKEQPAPAE